MLGRQQIAGIPTAISELFKNAHDAYADFAEVDFLRKDSLFVLRDDGIGMTEDEFLNRWLAIGTESKVGTSVGVELPPKPKGRKKRPMLGEKGIGRLAIAAIGPQVLILTRAIRGNIQHDTVAAFINWGIFESPGLNLDQIEIPVIPYGKGALPNRDDVLALVDLFRQNLTALAEIIPPELASRILIELDQFKLDPAALDSFLTGVSSPTLTGDRQGTHFLILPTNESLVPDIDGDRRDDDAPASPMIQRLIGFTNTMTDRVKPYITTAFRDHKPLEPFVDIISPTSFFTPAEFKTADHHFSGEFDEFGQFNGLVTIYDKEPINHNIQWTDGKGLRTKCGKFKLNLAYVQGRVSESLLPQDEWGRIIRKLKKIGGLYIYKNGIRVLPYGSSDYDFLSLEQERGKKASTAFFTYRRMFGFVEITTEENAALSEKAGREGFRENSAYREFRSILKNFFMQMAADFFNTSGIYSEPYVEGRTELVQRHEEKRAHAIHASNARRELGKDLDDFYQSVDDGLPSQESSRLLATVTAEIEDALKSGAPLEIAPTLIEIEANARQALQRIRENYELVKPRGVGLTENLRRDWRLYKSENQRLAKEVFQPAQEDIEKLIVDAVSRQPNVEHSSRRIAQALKDRIAAARKTIEGRGDVTTVEMENLNEQVRQLIENSLDTFNNSMIEAEDRLAAVIRSKTDEALVLGEYYQLEESIADTTELECKNLENLRVRLRQAVDSALHTDEIIEALDEENLALIERSDADLELAQLGMAVSAIGHEFRSTVSSIRSNLNRLKGWADVNKDLRELWRNIRSDFDHLDAYLQLFTPLQQRLFRKKISIKGNAIEDYLRRLFGERLQREKVDLRASSYFKRMSFDGYPSTFYPVFVNLVDNSLYWLKDRSGEKFIQLDIEDGSTLVVSDNGPGIPKRDREAIFEWGFTRKPGGRGMGLKISREVLAREGRELLLGDAKSGEGATFKIKWKPQKKKG